MLDFSLLGQGPDFGNALTSYRAGKEDRRQSNVRNALMTHKDDPSAAAPDLIANGEVEMGTRLEDRGKAQRLEADRKRVLGSYGADPATARTDALKTGDAELINQISQMDTTQRQIAATHADELASIGFALKNMPIEQRKAALQQPQMAEYLASRGFKPEQIAAFDPTDANLDGVIAQGTSLKDMIAQYKDERTAKMEADKFGETVRHNRATEGIAGQNADSRRITAERPRASDASLPPPPKGWAAAPRR